MENKEFQFKGMTMNGFAMLFVNIMLTVLSAAIMAHPTNPEEESLILQKIYTFVP